MPPEPPTPLQRDGPAVDDRVTLGLQTHSSPPMLPQDPVVKRVRAPLDEAEAARPPKSTPTRIVCNIYSPLPRPPLLEGFCGGGNYRLNNWFDPIWVSITQTAAGF